ncbi:MAG: CBS domain-containing protein, partial [Rikenellaceae bacterium]
IVFDSILNFCLNIDSGAVMFITKTLIISVKLIITVELLPKVAATAYPLFIASHTATTINILSIIFRPITYLLISGANIATNIFAHKSDPVSLDELSKVINNGTKEANEDKKILNGIVRFVGTEVADIMCPRIDVVTLNINDSFEEVKQTLIKSGFSRLPVYENEIDNIKGILYIKDLISNIDKPDFSWRTVLRKPYYVPENKKINDLLQDFQNRRVHLAIVVDEYGSMQGVISLEDILEEIVGEISDESDMAKQVYIKTAPDTYIFDGKTHITDFLKIFDLPDSYFDNYRGEAETLAGMMLEVNKDFLSQGDEQQLGQFTFTVTKLSLHRIEKIKITK